MKEFFLNMFKGTTAVVFIIILNIVVWGGWAYGLYISEGVMFWICLFPPFGMMVGWMHIIMNFF